jgi:hypothetical protein
VQHVRRESLPPELIGRIHRLLFHRRAGTKVIADGRRIREECPTCQRITELEEVESGESFGVFFVDVVGDRERGFRCRTCGDVFQLRDESAAPALPPAGVARVEQLAAEQRRRDAERAANAVKVEDELAELKRRMGK